MLKSILRFPHKEFSTKFAKNIESQIASANKALKAEAMMAKDEKFYMEKMSEKRVEKIGSATLLDKQWADKPINVIRNPHKLSEVELYKTLNKIVEMPEKRLKTMLKQGDIDEVFLKNVAERIPQFLTATIVNLTKSLLIQKDYFRDHPIWSLLEQELYKRRKNLNNEQLAQVLNAFGVTGNGSKEFYHEMEEVVTDSQILIETEFLEKILTGYAAIDLGSPVFYNVIVTKILERGLDSIDPVKITEIAKTLRKATNVQKGGYGFFSEMEKHIKNSLHQGKIDFLELTKIVENILPGNIGSNEFHAELEKFLICNYHEENLNDIVNLIKGLSLYHIKNEELNLLLFKTIAQNEFSVKQMEILLWSLSRKHMAHHPDCKITQLSDFEPYQQQVIMDLIDKIKTKSPSMRARGIAFAIDSISNLNCKDQATFDRFERVILAKIDEFIPHYLVKVLQSYYKMGFGSNELYDQLINKIMQAMQNPGQLKYSDLLRFFEIYPEVSYIYENTMSSEIYNHFISTIHPLLKDKKFPTEDVCKTFNIMIRICGYFEAPREQMVQGQILIGNSDAHQKFLQEIVGRIRHSVYDIPQDQFCKTMSNLIEFQQPEIASKFVYIIKEILRQNKPLDFSPGEKIELFWSLMQIEKVVMDTSDSKLISNKNLAFLNDIDLETLSPRHFILYKQLVCLSKMWSDSQNNALEEINYDLIYQKFEEISDEKRQYLISEETARFTNPQVIEEIVEIIPIECVKNSADDLMNLFEITCSEFVMQIFNKKCYLPPIIENDVLLRRSVEIKQQILEEMSGIKLLTIDEEDFLMAKDKKSYILERIGITEKVKPTSGGRKIKRK